MKKSSPYSLILFVQLLWTCQISFAIGRGRKREKATRSKRVSKESWEGKGQVQKGEKGVLFPSTNFSRVECNGEGSYWNRKKI